MNEIIGNLNVYEIIGTLFGVASVILAAKENIWVWPTGIISVVVYFIFYMEIKMYASMVLQAIFLGFCIHGWYQWLYGGEERSKLKTSHIALRQIIYSSIIIVLFTGIGGLLFSKYTDTNLPYLDSFLLAISIAAQVLMNHKVVESWIYWIITDSVYSMIHLLQKNYPSFLLYASYLVFATIGLILWKKSIKRETNLLR